MQKKTGIRITAKNYCIGCGNDAGLDSMDYIGKEVLHQKYGKGTIVAQGKTSISVLFLPEKEPRKFVYPDCFNKYLHLMDPETESFAKQESLIKGHSLASKEEKLKKEEQEKAASVRTVLNPVNNKTRSDKSIKVPSYSSVEDFFSSQVPLLMNEINYLRNNGGKRTKILDGKLVDTDNGVYIYSFEADSELNLPDNTLITLWLSNISQGLPAVAINCEEFTVIIAVSANLGNTVPIIEFSAEPWRLLSYLIDRLKALSERPSGIVKELVCDGKKKIQKGKQIIKGQDEAKRMSISQPITFIWGPPGTGKTETLANIALQHLNNGYRVLMLSYSNVSVDGAIMRVFRKDAGCKPGRLVRYGYPRDKELLRHEYLTSYNLTLKNHPLLARERRTLIEERKRVSRASRRYVEIGQRLTQIKNELDQEEKNAVEKARFVATTVSKAIADKLLYEGSFDTVIFDEASMAYIPQIVFSAGLARKHFICIGDFAQLPPIVQSDSTNSLNTDIFKYCGIVDAVEQNAGHEWLCMLDTQYRMHPDIAAFSSTTMYHGLLKSGPDMLNQRKPIAGAYPFAGNPLYMADLSGMISVCTKTADKSRINVLSAIVSMGLAINAAKEYEVGIITPYNAQSRLLHAMSRDVMQQSPGLKKITCATVHQFQGSEKDVIVYDAVDCYRMQYPGTLLTNTANNYANRLYNVAVTRARGKMISVVNADYMEKKNLSSNLIFRRMIDNLKRTRKVSYGDTVIKACSSDVLRTYDSRNGEKEFLNDLTKASQEINIDISETISCSESFVSELIKHIQSAKSKGVRVHIRTDNKAGLPTGLRQYAIQSDFIANPVVLIDRTVMWYGMPFSGAEFQSEGKVIPTQYRPVVRFMGRHFAQALYGFLEMNNRIDTDTVRTQISVNDDMQYHTFASYVSGEMECPECGAPMQMKRGKNFFLGCSNYPKCTHKRWITPEDVENYLYFHNRKGKRCPQDNTSIVAKVGYKGLYICCCGSTKHFFKLDEI